MGTHIKGPQEFVHTGLWLPDGPITTLQAVGAWDGRCFGTRPDSRGWGVREDGRGERRGDLEPLSCRARSPLWVRMGSLTSRLIGIQVQGLTTVLLTFGDPPSCYLHHRAPRRPISLCRGPPQSETRACQFTWTGKRRRGCEDSREPAISRRLCAAGEKESSLWRKQQAIPL